MSDHYLTLGIRRGASTREITRAYRRLARLYHPDVSAAPALTVDRFLAVQEAYETLSDARRRADYDAELRRRERPLSPPASGVVMRPPAPTVVREPLRAQQPPLDARPSTIALILLGTGAVALVAAVALERAVAGDLRFVWGGICVALGVASSLLAREVAARQLDRLWRWSARGGRAALRNSGAARAAHRRIEMAAALTLLGRRAVLIAIPIVFLLGSH